MEISSSVGSCLLRTTHHQNFKNTGCSRVEVEDETTLAGRWTLSLDPVPIGLIGESFFKKDGARFD